MSEDIKPKWIPESEYKAMVEFRASMTLEEHRRFAYFMWNNFSYDGYEEFTEKQDQVQENEKI